jgi:hypothetical protein
MPHKHKRKRGSDDAAEFNLPPSTRAVALPVNKPKAVVTNDDDDSAPKRSNKRRKPSKPKASQQQTFLDDTPKQFARLMAFTQGKKLRRGLDDGTRAPKQKKKPSQAAGSTKSTTLDTAHAPEAIAETEQAAKQSTALKIQPGERLSDFALRVDQSLPLSQVPKHSTRAPTIEGVKEKTYLTKHNKRLARMQAQWREEEEKIKEKREEKDEERDDQREEDGLLWMDVEEARLGKKGKKKRSGREGDIWAELERKRREDGKDEVGRLGGLNAKTAVQAPPVLKGVKNMFKEKSHVMTGRRVMAARN